MDRKLLLTMIVLVALAAGLARVSAQQRAGSAALGSAFMYQGRLMDGDQPATDVYQMIFRLYDAQTGGTQVGAALTQSVSVQEGLFTAQLDFGPGAFAGGQRFLEIEVGGTTLEPRQAITAAPYAIYASSVPWGGVSGVPADLADGDDVGLTSVGWTDVLSRPAGLDDGDDDTTYTAGGGLVLNGTQFGVDSSVIQSRVTGSCGAGSSIGSIAANGSVTCEVDDNSTYTAGSGLVLNGTQFRVAGSPISNTLIVAKGGGDYTSIQAALNSITNASAANPYLIYVASGVYVEQITLKPYVTIEGAGEGVTIIRWNGNPQITSVESSAATVVGANNAALRRLTIESDGSASPGGGVALGLYTATVSPTLSNVTVRALGSWDVFGIYNDGGAPALNDVTVIAAAGNNNTGISNTGAMVMDDVTVLATARTTGGFLTLGMYNASSSLMMNDVLVRVTGNNVSSNTGISAASTTISSTPTLRDVTVQVSGTNTLNIGIQVSSGLAATIDDVVVSVSGVSSTNYGIAAAGSAISASSALIRESVISASTYSIFLGSNATVKVAYSQLDGPVDFGATCLGAYTSSLTPATCP